MSDGASSVRKGIGIGCLVVIAIPILVVLVVVTRTAVPLRSASHDMRRLEERFGAPAAYTPPPDGAAAPDRILAFLAVRDALAEPCADARRLLEPMRRMDALGDGSEPTGREVAEATRDVGGVALRITPFIGQFLGRRNRALLEAGMGLGEYGYLYALAYRERLLEPSLRTELFSSDSPLAPDAYGMLRAILGNQARTPGGDSTALRAEIAALERDPARIPWADGLPVHVAASLAPFRERLDAGYCAGLTGIELDRDPGRALRIALE